MTTTDTPPLDATPRGHDRARQHLSPVAVGAIVRHTARGTTGIMAFVLVLTQLIPGTVGDHIPAYLPTVVGQLMVAARQGPDDLTPWQGFGLFCLWTLALMLVADYLQASRCMSRRMDSTDDLDRQPTELRSKVVA